MLRIFDSVTGALVASQGNVRITVGAWDNTGLSNNGGVDYPKFLGLYAKETVRMDLRRESNL